MFIKNFSKVLIITIGLLLTISKSYAGILSPVADLYLTLEFNKSYLSHKNINSNFSRNYNFKDNISTRFANLHRSIHVVASIKSPPEV